MQVCLSLLGTWHGTDASQKWDPQNSSLFQILLSIQGMILISDPYFNEPNVERMRGQAEGTKASNGYNAEIHLNNIRSAFGCFLTSVPCIHSGARRRAPLIKPYLPTLSTGSSSLHATIHPLLCCCSKPQNPLILLYRKPKSPCSAEHTMLNEVSGLCRWGMIDQLRKPKPGFEAVTKLHFTYLKHTLMDQCKAWFEESADLDVLYRRRLADAIVELHGLLDAL